MKTLDDSTVLDPQQQADEEAVLRQLTDGIPVSEDVKRRVRERSQKVVDEIRRKHGDVDVDALLRDARDES